MVVTPTGFEPVSPP